MISKGLVNSLDRMRIDRHEAVYGLEVSVRSAQAANGLKESEQFIQAAKHLLISEGKRTSQPFHHPEVERTRTERGFPPVLIPISRPEIVKQLGRV